MATDQLKLNHLIRGALFPEAVRVVAVVTVGDATKLVGIGQRTSQACRPILLPNQFVLLDADSAGEIFDGDARRLQ
jgi:hypothetical protein